MKRARSVTNDPYAWERAYERPWELIEEDASSGLLKLEASKARRAGQRREIALSRVQRGMLRNVFLILDASRSMESPDPSFKPSRAASLASAAKEFVREFFDSNPISALGVIVLRDGIATLASELSSNPKRHVGAIVEHVERRGCGGNWSLQSGLEMARRLLEMVPVYATREVLIVHAALSTVDAGNIYETLGQVSALPDAGGGEGRPPRLRVSVVSLSGEVHICTRVAADTGGSYSVPMGSDGLVTALLAQCVPPGRPAEGGSGDGDAAGSAGMMETGFPKLVVEVEGLCTCHKSLRSKAHVCPRCSARCCEIPSKCAVCKLQLVSAPGLARSYHHLFPVPLFTEVPSALEPGVEEEKQGEGAGAGGEEHARAKRRHVHNADEVCSGCIRALAASAPRYVCPDCALAFCDDCDAAIHDVVHSCPGCIPR